MNLKYFSSVEVDGDSNKERTESWSLIYGVFRTLNGVCTFVSGVRKRKNGTSSVKLLIARKTRAAEELYILPPNLRLIYTFTTRCWHSLHKQRFRVQVFIKFIAGRCVVWSNVVVV